MAVSDNSYGSYWKLPKHLESIPQFPMPTEEEQRAINRLFDAYVFYKTVRGGRLLWTSCCGEKAVFYPSAQQTETPEHYEFMTARHNSIVRCPFCGAPATLKASGMKRGGLTEWEPVLILREMEGDLAALGVWVRKEYKTERDLAARPLYHITSAYRFSPGRAVQYWNDWNTKGVNELTGPIDPKHLKIRDPFTVGGYLGGVRYESYWVIGMDAISKSAFRYCQYDLFCTGNGPKRHMMEYLAACCIWPRDIEMLMKCGLRDIVLDLILGVRKNADVYRWGSDSPQRAFGLNGQEMRAWRDAGLGVEDLRIYKRLRAAGFRHSFALAKSIKEVCRYEEVGFIRICRRSGVEPDRVLRWLGWNDGICSRGLVRVRGRYGSWKDYLRFCERLGYDLTDETVFMPKDFQRRHDEAAEEVKRRDRIERELQRAEMAMRFEKRLRILEKKYDFEHGGLTIRVARNYEEIVDEGNALKHCVGGYAGRHIEGKVTILFLRRAAAPDRPYVTVEMDRDRLVQAHGFENDAGRESPQKTHKEFFDLWLDWLKRGSPRDKDGAPKLRREKGAKVA